MKTNRYVKKAVVGAAFLLFVFSFLANPAVTPMALGEEDVIKIGVILPLSGFLATSGAECKNGLELAVDDINKAGGIKSMGGAKLELVVTDSTGKPEVGMGEAERLILRQKVHVIVGAYQSSVTFASSNVAEKYKVPYLVSISQKDEITSRPGFKHVFRHLASSSIQIEYLVKAWMDICEELDYTFKTAAIVGESSDFGQDSAMYEKKILTREGIEILLHESYPFTVPDVSPIITKLKNANPDAIFMTGYVADSVLMIKTAHAMGLKKPFVTTGGENFPDFLEAVGHMADGHFLRSTFEISLAETFPEIKKITDRYRKRFGINMHVSGAGNYVLINILRDALERAGTTDSKQLRDALSATDIPAGQPWMVEFNDRITFDEGGQNPKPPFIFMQYQDAGKKVIWPKEHRQAEPYLPIP